MRPSYDEPREIPHADRDRNILKLAQDRADALRRRLARDVESDFADTGTGRRADAMGGFERAESARDDMPDTDGMSKAEVVEKAMEHCDKAEKHIDRGEVLAAMREEEICTRLLGRAAEMAP